MSKKLENYFKNISLERVASCAPNGVTPFPKPDRPEVAFVGRSNVGKSTLINAILGGRKIARTSNTPGATRGVHFFATGNECYVVDLPGYGFAKLPHDVTEKLGELVNKYFSTRESLKCVYVLVDARRGLKEMDTDLLTGLHEAGIPYQTVLTKLDKLKEHQQKAAVREAGEHLVRLGLNIHILATGATKFIGIDEARQHIIDICELKI